jgi:hypothetical protein
MRRRFRRSGSFVWAIGVLVLWPAATRAQSTDFRLSASALTFPTPTMANFTSWPPSATGPVTDSVPVTFVVDRVRQSSIRVTTVLLRCAGASGVKTCSDIEWRSDAGGGWRPLTLIDEEVESRTVIPILFNDPWSGTIWFRVRVDWSDPAPSVSTSNIALTLSVYRP